MSSSFAYAFDNKQELNRSSALPASLARQSLGPEIILFCETCRAKTRHLSIAGTVRLLGIGRSTTYYWMKKGWAHWQEMPRGHRFICQESLGLRPLPEAESVTTCPWCRTEPADEQGAAPNFA